jgi:hypothetical protein
VQSGHPQFTPLFIHFTFPSRQLLYSQAMENLGFTELFVALLAVLLLYKYCTRDRRLAYLPPHVPGWPIVNQTLVQWRPDPVPLIRQWAQDFGELFCTTSGTTMFIWVNSRKAFKELIDRRSAIYSSRHPQPMVTRASGGKRILFAPYGRQWRALRNIIHRVISSFVCF